MRYFEVLNLRREPFSNSPDPELFYRTKQHRECLQALEIAIRLKRGLSVVTGHVGTGKTTLCRQLIRVLAERQGVVTHLILDPTFSDARELLVQLNGFFGVDAQAAGQASDWQLRENIKNALWGLAVEEDQLVVLIVDEGQKMSLECLEILRELLNFETNENKLLQIVIFGQLEFEPILEAKANLADRVNLRYRIEPLDFQDTRELIQARLAMCSKDISPEGLFSFGALLAVFLATDGFPRQIVQLCHQALLAVIIKERPRVTWGVVRSCMRWRTLGLPRHRRWPWALAGALCILLAVAGAAVYLGLVPFEVGRIRASMPEVHMPDVASWFRSSVASRQESVPTDASAPAQETKPAAELSTVGQDKTGTPAQGITGPQPDYQTSVEGKTEPNAFKPTQDLNAPSLLGAEPTVPEQPGNNRSGGLPRFTGVRADFADGMQTLDILTDKPVERFEAGFKPNPSRIVVDLFGAWERKTERELSVGSSRIDKVRSAVHPDKLRVAVYLKDASAAPIRPVVEKTPSGLKIILK
ncbi:MAG: AAA family ATPase [Desulfovibrio sp.]|nr:AAA family ATPase [Desulfovibrio sp.]MBI4958208.1 AAA family ATPase [Desulfovibrio sp.]